MPDLRLALPAIAAWAGAWLVVAAPDAGVPASAAILGVWASAVAMLSALIVLRVRAKRLPEGAHPDAGHHPVSHAAVRRCAALLVALAATRMPSTASTRPSTRCGSPDAAASSPPSNHGADIARGAPLSSTMTLTMDPLDAASASGERRRASRAAPADVATSPVAASATSSAAHHRTAACDARC